MKQRVSDVRDRLTMEHVLLATFIGTSVYMLVESYGFQPAGAMFPRFTSVAVIVLGFLIVFRTYLPTPLQRVVTDSGGMFDVDEPDVGDDAAEGEAEGSVEETEGVETEGMETEGVEEEVVDGAKDAEGGAATVDDDADAHVGRGTLVTGGLCVAYLFASYLVGMLWATPLFVVAYTAWTRQRWYAIVGLGLLSFGIAFLFYDVLNLDIASGWIHEWLVTEVL